MRSPFVGVLLVLCALAFAGSALAKAPERSAVTGSDIVLNDDATLEEADAPALSLSLNRLSTLASAAVQTPALGTEKFWYSRNGNALVRDRLFKLRAITAHSEIWVSKVLDFKAGDCRNDGDRNVLTDAQVAYLADQFENNIYAKESTEFSVPPFRDGTHALRGQPGTSFSLTGGDNYYAGDGDKIVILVDNVRDENYNDLNNSHGLSYIAGFFSSGINTNLDRNVMTLESYESPGENTWVNEGLSDYAIALTGYVDPATPITQTGFDSHIQCFLGWLGVQTPANPNPRATSGPENSLTNWNDQGDLETLCDYGAAFTFALWLSNHYGSAFMSALHREDANGLPGLQKVLDSFLTGKKAQDVIHEWAATVAADKALDTGVGLRDGSSPAPFQIAAMNSDIYWGTTEAYSTPGAPPNGSDYVQLRDGAENPLTAEQLSSLKFKGTTQFAPLPTQWTVDANPPLQAGNPAYFGGRADNLDNAMAHEVTVPAGTPTLAADILWSTEEAFDSLFVQVSTDGGKTWTSLGNGDTTNQLSPSANAKLKSNLPGLNGESTTWKHEVFDLTPYAGQKVWISFRYITDSDTRGVDFDGVWVDNITVGGVAVGDGTLTGWKSLTEVNPVKVTGFTVQLVGIDTNRKTPVALGTIPLSSTFEATLDVGKLRRIVGTQADVVGAIVTYDEPTEQITDYARYQLWANGALQPGG